MLRRFRSALTTTTLAKVRKHNHVFFRVSVGPFVAIMGQIHLGG